MSVKEMAFFCSDFILEIYGIKNMNGEYSKILLQIKGVLQGIDQSLHNLAENFDKLTKQIVKESEKEKD